MSLKRAITDQERAPWASLGIVLYPTQELSLVEQEGVSIYSRLVGQSSNTLCAVYFGTAYVLEVKNSFPGIAGFLDGVYQDSSTMKDICLNYGIGSVSKSIFHTSEKSRQNSNFPFVLRYVPSFSKTWTEKDHPCDETLSNHVHQIPGLPRSSFFFWYPWRIGKKIE